MQTENQLQIGEHPLGIRDVVKIAKNKKIKVVLSNKAKDKILKSRAVVENIVRDKKAVYGVTTGFGMFKNKFIAAEEVKNLQKNLIRSHAIGTGDYFSEEVVRAAILIRLNSLSHGNSGVRLELIESLVQLLNSGIYPCIPAKGSVGASGDLAPLSHLALVMMGEGEVIEGGQRKKCQSVLEKNNINPLVLEAKEGLAMNNGTSFMTAIACLNVTNAEVISQSYDLILSLSLEGLAGTITAFEERVHQLRPHQGQLICASNIRQICQGSKIIASYNQPERIQDSYSLRCSPQVHGASKDALAYVKKIIETEINSVTDNPLIFADDHNALSAGHFHGQPISLAMDFLSMAISELGNISERRIAKMVDSNNSEGLPSFLIDKDKGGLNNGYMIAQYTAAALVAENKVLAHPVCIDSIPTSANQEDHVSFGTIAARQCQEIINNVFDILTIEAMLAAQAVEYRGEQDMAAGTRLVHDCIREKVPHLEDDRILYLDLESLRPDFKEGRILEIYQSKFGNLL
ncbi:MAG: histidine ammonia-lyase [Candidatus Komeilibacteria bacterium CG11_big_fil_rev_8_21_14_0_20_36_20]|uniref:Histidine ammonia-lyase n=1 Tax=Candidatus Komeilibacteria bacterium CG11_big_fil_rev_8_21_14_0_20_36_20 TaxID=1974477 RepID=A0A2H0NCC3_9BACT|nr:MAG: histidine ammonia-lyase [Candidatus Komeilibacteria bacterium CG11_big_fil_rev_8_21_14_0_20_36_20]PIR81882.1 MAG: histidine ammonia-lyase [Candidatus Komeilibacteria bacterium CG10_big_fil_rev_8_21_14_0_10_36_65]PJC55389.1 MAG: histidine ammonia-lyase [Candidatus Komeilibacteria bacterium CG_4_9_14_0_2_um_filter_36_13]